MHAPEAPSFYDAVTVGERGQIVIPQSAREALGIKPGDKILVMGAGPGTGNFGLMLIKADTIGEFIANMSARINERLSYLEKLAESAGKFEKDNEPR